ncbi:cyclase family protein [Gammaproteobacteria bacterium]|uniref:Cyclase n=1 Tax=OM182 bacterium MED-G28 TaxID=1986256 RepID=A0A2A5W8J5_9GAMM|nr:cyclase [Gammaproteobacteria bacterium]MDC0220342.1 cyclase family protein [Gammaproteobacteria bacterium]PDH32790.1 MAG: cyclase [OM182 bacterium MED-G28]
MSLSLRFPLILIIVSTFFPAISQERPPMETNEDFHRAMEELSNWGRWGEDDELGQANFITPQKRVDAAALVIEGITVSLSHDVVQEDAVDTSAYLKREVVRVSPTGASDRLAYTGSYHGTIHSHLDSLDCHIMYEGQGYNGVGFEEVEAADGCPRGSIHAHRNGVITRGILFDATLLPGRATEEGWLEPGAAITYDDLVALEEIQGVRVEPGDVILLHTGRWSRRAAIGAWPTSEGVAGYHADVAYFLKDRGVAMIGHDMWNDVAPSGVGDIFLPLHSLALVSLGVSIFDNLDFTDVAVVAKELGRYEFLFMASPLRIEKGMGSPLNPIATF